MTKISIIIILVLLIIGAVYLINYESPKVDETQGNGTTATSTSDTFKIKIGQTMTSLGVKITPLLIVEDSRCPSDVQCIQSGLGTATQIFKLNEPITTEAESVELIGVSPDKVSTVQVQPGDYEFVFEIKKR